MQDTGSLGLVHWDDPEGWYGERGEAFIVDGKALSNPARLILGSCDFLEGSDTGREDGWYHL